MEIDMDDIRSYISDVSKLDFMQDRLEKAGVDIDCYDLDLFQRMSRLNLIILDIEAMEKAGITDTYDIEVWYDEIWQIRERLSYYYCSSYA